MGDLGEVSVESVREQRRAEEAEKAKVLALWESYCENEDGGPIRAVRFCRYVADLLQGGHLNERREAIKAGYAAYPDHVLRHVMRYNREKWVDYPRPHPIKTEQLEVADIAEEILAEREAAAAAKS